MLKLTLDTNCLIDIHAKRTSAPYVQQLLDAAANGKADVAMVASSASEKQKDGTFLTTSRDFRDLMKRLGFGHIELLPPLLWYDIGFWDEALLADDAAAEREALIFKTMFPTSILEWADHAAMKGVDPADEASPVFYKWRNQLLDAQAFWAHDHHGRDIFVTRDTRFHRLVGVPAFPRAVVKNPQEAAALL